ncbi:MAG: hydroxymethylglutaryl-CoA lyase [Pseudoxanthomonas sp.]
MSDNRVHLVEVGPRDGLQNEARFVATADKVSLIEQLAACGLPSVEATSFVSPRWVPQLADAEAVMQALQRQPGVAYPVLVPNLQGYQRAHAVGAREVAVFTAASEAFNLRNTNAGIQASLQRFAPVLAQATQDGVRVRGYVSTVLGCPYQGDVPVSEVVRVAKALYDMGCREISLGDTIGVGTPHKARQMLLAVADEVPMSALAVHFHDTYGQALANLLACLESGVRVVDAAIAGSGGCPYAPGASGNVATEDVVYLLQGLGMETGVDLENLCRTGAWLAQLLGRPTGSKVARARSGA